MPIRTPVTSTEFWNIKIWSKIIDFRFWFCLKFKFSCNFLQLLSHLGIVLISWDADHIKITGGLNDYLSWQFIYRLLKFIIKHPLQFCPVIMFTLSTCVLFCFIYLFIFWSSLLISFRMLWWISLWTSITYMRISNLYNLHP